MVISFLEEPYPIQSHKSPTYGDFWLTTPAILEGCLEPWL